MWIIKADCDCSIVIAFTISFLTMMRLQKLRMVTGLEAELLSRLAALTEVRGKHTPHTFAA